MKHFLLWRGLMFQTKFSYLTHNHGRGGQQVLEISAPTGGASGYLQSHLASAGRVGRGRRAGGGGCKGAANTLLSVGTRTRRCNRGGITHSPLHMGVFRPPLPTPQRAPLLRYCRLVLVLLSTHFIIVIGVFFTGQTLHLQVYIQREERGRGQLVIDNIKF